MRTTDLMIGDWVIEKDRVCRVSFNTIIEEVRKEDCATSASSSTRYYDIEPIPLTPEILEKNGYVFQDWWYEQKGYPDITNMFSDDKYEVGKHAYYGKGQPEFNSIIQIQYVHELQHALKLCGIEKEIEL